jgi:hypothetical protein
MKLLVIVKDLWETTRSVLPLILLLIFIQIVVLRKPIKNTTELVVGVLLCIGGLHLFLKGAFMSILTLGDSVGENLAIIDKKWVIVLISLGIGYLGTLVEPAIKTLALEVEEVSIGAIPHTVLIHAVAIGFGIGMGLGIFKILNNISYIKIVIPLLILIILLIPFAPKEYVPIAMDAASATTGPVNIPLNMTIAIGLSKTLENVDPLTAGFGIVGLTSIGAILSVLILGLLTRF